jgi:hypothetical protein
LHCSSIRFFLTVIQRGAEQCYFGMLHLIIGSYPFPLFKECSGNCFLRVTDATHVYRTRYSLDIKLKTLSPECSFSNHFLHGFRSCRVGGHDPLHLILAPKQRMEWFAVLKNIVKCG